MTPSEAGRLIALIHSLWPTVPWRADEPALTVASWHLLLAGVDAGEAIRVVRDFARSGREFPPAPGVIAKMVLDARDRDTGTGTPDVDQAWAEVVDKIGSVGYTNGPPLWSHPAVDAAVRAITWRELCMSTNGEAIRAHFMKLYDVAAKRITADARRDDWPQIAPALGSLISSIPELER